MTDTTTNATDTSAVPAAQAVSATPPTDAAGTTPPVADTAPVTAEVVAETVPVVEAAKATTVLGSDPVPEIKTDDKSPDAVEAPVEAPKEEGAQSDEPAPLPSYEAFEVPDGFTVDDTKLSEFTKELGTLEGLTNADHAMMQEFGQKLVNRHIAEVQETVQRLQDYYTNTWEKTKSDWKEAFEKDPEIGGNRKDTTVRAALEFIKTHGGDETQQKEFRDLMESTGVGNHPAMIRLLAKANMALREGKPIPATKPEQRAISKVAKRYGTTT